MELDNLKDNEIQVVLDKYVWIGARVRIRLSSVMPVTVDLSRPAYSLPDVGMLYSFADAEDANKFAQVMRDSRIVMP